MSCKTLRQKQFVRFYKVLLKHKKISHKARIFVIKHFYVIATKNSASHNFYSKIIVGTSIFLKQNEHVIIMKNIIRINIAP